LEGYGASKRKREREGVVWPREKVPLQVACGARDMRAGFLFSFCCYLIYFPKFFTRASPGAVHL